MLGASIEHFLVPRLTTGARTELAALGNILQEVQLSSDEDRRLSPMPGMENGLRAGPVYQLTMQATGADQCDYATFVWRNRAPPRVQFFAWLLTRQRLNCRTNLRGKNLLDDTSCKLCASGDEDYHHLILSCPFANQAWQALGMDATLGDVAKLWALPRPATIPTRHFDSLFS